jgi:hypothetical protein
MSTTDPTCPAVYPTGATLLTTINNPTKGSLITPPALPIQLTTEPLPPVVSSAVLTGTTITVSVTVYIDSADPVTSLMIYENLTNATPQFYVVYDFAEEIPASLYPYTFTFPYTPCGQAPTTIETFLWDSDPIASRGTETTVVSA